MLLLDTRDCSLMQRRMGSSCCGSLLLLYVFLALYVLHQAQGRPLSGRGHQLVFQPARYRLQEASGNSTWVAHSCLWNAGQRKPTEQTPEAAVSNTGSNQAGQRSRGAQCSLNPSYFFSLPAPELDSERLLLELTAMRYSCLEHTSFPTCAVDQANWCTWHEERGRCEMTYDDADFVHLLLWSRTRAACKGSKLEQLVTCSYITLDTDCTDTCAWAEGACYPAWYAPLVSSPQSIQSFKRQVYTGDPEVWGTCAGADLYRTYSNICSHGQDECMQDPQCQWINDFEAHALSNPLNFTKPCLLSTNKFSIESVFLSFNSDFSAAVIKAQQDCIRARTETSCNKKEVKLALNALSASLTYNPSTAPATGYASAGGGITVAWAEVEDLPAPQPQGKDAVMSSNMHSGPAEGAAFGVAEWENISAVPVATDNSNPNLGFAGFDAHGEPLWFIKPCGLPAACTSAFAALSRLHILPKPMVGPSALRQL